MLHISRPRFWVYLLGPYAVGVAAGLPSAAPPPWPWLLAFALFFTLPANLLVYGVNDIFDYETDRRNPRKSAYEALVQPAEHRPLAHAILLLCLPFGAALFLTPAACRWAAAGFVFFAVFYSAPPLRAKARPLLDSAFNVLYVFPGLLGYWLAGGDRLHPALVLAAWCWTMAMHAYSAVPDIAADRESGLRTIATALGLRATLCFCLAMYVLSAAMAYPALAWPAGLLGVLYAGMMLLSLEQGTESGVRRIYRSFPALNTAAGAVLFLRVLTLRGWL